MSPVPGRLPEKGIDPSSLISLDESHETLPPAIADDQTPRAVNDHGSTRWISIFTLID